MLTRGHDARYSPTGHLVFGRDGALWAVSFDSERLAIAGDPVQVIPQIVTLRTGAVQFGLSTNGTLAYLTEGTPAETRLGWVDRHGEMTEVVLDDFVIDAIRKIVSVCIARPSARSAMP